MGFQKVRMGRGFISSLQIKDESGAKVDEWTSMLCDFPKVYSTIKNKYGLLDLIEQKDKDLDWAKK